MCLLLPMPWELASLARFRVRDPRMDAAITAIRHTHVLGEPSRQSKVTHATWGDPLIRNIHH
jgi:hypothetical protein